LRAHLQLTQRPTGRGIGATCPPPNTVYQVACTDGTARARVRAPGEKCRAKGAAVAVTHNPPPPAAVLVSSVSLRMAAAAATSSSRRAHWAAPVRAVQAPPATPRARCSRRAPWTVTRRLHPRQRCAFRLLRCRSFYQDERWLGPPRLGRAAGA